MCIRAMRTCLDYLCLLLLSNTIGKEKGAFDLDRENIYLLKDRGRELVFINRNTVINFIHLYIISKYVNT